MIPLHRMQRGRETTSNQHCSGSAATVFRYRQVLHQVSSEKPFNVSEILDFRTEDMRLWTFPRKLHKGLLTRKLSLLICLKTFPHDPHLLFLYFKKIIFWINSDLQSTRVQRIPIYLGPDPYILMFYHILSTYIPIFLWTAYKLQMPLQP